MALNLSRIYTHSNVNTILNGKIIKSYWKKLLKVMTIIYPMSKSNNPIYICYIFNSLIEIAN